MHKGSLLSTSSPAFTVNCILVTAIVTGVWWNPCVVLICISLYWGQTLFQACWLSVFYLSRTDWLFVLLVLLIALFDFLWFRFSKDLYILHINPWSEVWWRFLSCSVCCLCLNSSFLGWAEAFSFVRFHLSAVDLIFWVATVLFRKSFPIPISWSIF